MKNDPEVTVEQSDKPKETHPEPVSDPQRPALWDGRDGAEPKPKAADSVRKGDGHFDGDPITYAIEGKYPPAGSPHEGRGPNVPDVLAGVLKGVEYGAKFVGQDGVALGAGFVGLPVEAYALAEQIVHANSPEAKRDWLESHDGYHRQYAEEFHNFTTIWDRSPDVKTFLKELKDVPITSEGRRDARATLISLAIPTSGGSFEKLGGYLDKLTAARDSYARENAQGNDTPGVIARIKDGKAPVRLPTPPR